MLDFKLNYYFELYKDTCCLSTSKFKMLFIKKHGEFELLNELVIMIHKYQYKKYGALIETGRAHNKRPKKNTFNNKENSRLTWRFGTKEERNRRKLKYGG